MATAGKKKGKRNSRPKKTIINDRQRLFITEYTKDYNASRAARAAGYRSPTAGGKLLDRDHVPHVVAEIERIQKVQLAKSELTKEKIIEELGNIAFRDPIELCEDGVLVVDDLSKIPAHIRRCIDGIEVEQRFGEDGELLGQKFKLKLVAKLGAIEMLMKHFGLYSPQEVNVQHSLDWEQLYLEAEQEENDLDIIEGKIAEAGK